MRRSWLIWFIVWAIMTAGLITWATLSVASAKTASEEFQEMLEKTLKEHPEIILDVLRNNSEAVLDIAQQGQNQRNANILMLQWENDLKVPKKVLLANRPIRGERSAPVTITAFSDFTCPYCQQAAATVAALMKTYAGQVRYVFKHYPLETHGNARLAAQYHIATSLQNTKKSWEFYDRIFARPDLLVAQGEAFLKSTAKSLKFDMRRLVADVNGRTVKAILDEDRLDAERIGVKGTPFFLVNNIVIRGALPLELFSNAIKMAIANEKQTKAKQKPKGKGK